MPDIVIIGAATTSACRSASPSPEIHDNPYPYDVRLRRPDVSKAKRLLGFEATTDLGTVLDEVIPWIKGRIALNRI